MEVNSYTSIYGIGDTTFTHGGSPPFGQVRYERWVLSFDGPTAHLPDPVPVTISTSRGTLTRLKFCLVNDVNGVDEGPVTLDFPRAGGGSVGSTGSVLLTNSGRGRPRTAYTLAGNPGVSGTATLEATGVETATITFERV